MMLWLKAVGAVLGVVVVFGGAVGLGVLFFMWIGVQWLPVFFIGAFLVAITIHVHDRMKNPENYEEDKNDYKGIGDFWNA